MNTGAERIAAYMWPEIAARNVAWLRNWSYCSGRRDLADKGLIVTLLDAPGHPYVVHTPDELYAFPTKQAFVMYLETEHAIANVRDA